MTVLNSYSEITQVTGHRYRVPSCLHKLAGLPVLSPLQHIPSLSHHFFSGSTQWERKENPGEPTYPFSHEMIRIAALTVLLKYVACFFCLLLDWKKVLYVAAWLCLLVHLAEPLALRKGHLERPHPLFRSMIPIQWFRLLKCEPKGYKQKLNLFVQNLLEM